MAAMSAGAHCADRRARSMSAMLVMPRKSASCADPSTEIAPLSVWATATERTIDENSSARIFIGDGALGLVPGRSAGDLHDDQAVGSRDQPARAIEPFDEGDGAFRLKVRFQTSA